jgi:hypothetical protein
LVILKIKILSALMVLQFCPIGEKPLSILPSAVVFLGKQKNERSLFTLEAVGNAHYRK